MPKVKEKMESPRPRDPRVRGAPFSRTGGGQRRQSGSAGAGSALPSEVPPSRCSPKTCRRPRKRRKLRKSIVGPMHLKNEGIWTGRAYLTARDESGGGFANDDQPGLPSKTLKVQCVVNEKKISVSFGNDW